MHRTNPKNSVLKWGKHGASNSIRKKGMVGEGLTDAALGFDAELRREMLCVIDRLTEEISGRFYFFV